MPTIVPHGIKEYLGNLPTRFNKDAVGMDALKITDTDLSGVTHGVGGWVRVENFTLSVVPGTLPFMVATISDAVTGGTLGVTETTLTLTPGAGSAAHVITLDLASQTVGQLMTAISAAGWTVVRLDTKHDAVIGATMNAKNLTVNLPTFTFQTPLSINVPTASSAVSIDLTQPSPTAPPLLVDGVVVPQALTLTDVRTQLLAAGFGVPALDTTVAAVAATALAEVSVSLNGSVMLQLATSPLWRIMLPIALEGGIEKARITDALVQYDIRQATGIWLDRIGEVYGLTRFSGESDDNFRWRIDFHVIRPHTTPLGLTLLVANVLDNSEIENTLLMAPEIVDSFAPEFFTCDDTASLTDDRTAMSSKRTPPGNVPLFTLLLDGAPNNPDPAPNGIDIACGCFHFRTDDSASLTGDGLEAGSTLRTPPANYRYLLAPDEVDEPDYRIRAALLPISRLLNRYKAAGVRYIIRNP